MPLPAILTPFRTPAYAKLAFAMCASVFGSGLWAVALVAQVMDLGGSAVELSLVTGVGAVGLVAFVLVGGVAADRAPLTTILRCVEAVNVLTALTVAVLVWLDLLAVWHLGVAAFAFSAALGFFFPAYSAALPRILPGEQLLAANGVEGTARPLLQVAAGPAVGGLLAGLTFPGLAVLAIATCHLVAFTLMVSLRLPRASRAGDERPQGSTTAPTSAVRDLIDGFLFTVRTPWLLGSLLWAMTSVLLFIGPLEVLVPFLVVDRLGGTVASFGAMLGMYGLATAAGSLITASLPLPRKYLTTTIWLWGLGTLPFGLVGTTDSWWVMAVALCAFGVTGGAGQVLWGTLLQRRVPVHMLGRVSSLDFFVSLSLMPVSMAIAGPLAQIIAPEVIFWAVAILTPVLGAIAIRAAHMYRDQAEHPLR